MAFYFALFNVSGVSLGNNARREMVRNQRSCCRTPSQIRRRTQSSDQPASAKSFARKTSVASAWSADLAYPLNGFCDLTKPRVIYRTSSYERPIRQLTETVPFGRHCNTVAPEPVDLGTVPNEIECNNGPRTFTRSRRRRRKSSARSRVSEGSEEVELPGRRSRRSKRHWRDKAKKDKSSKSKPPCDRDLPASRGLPRSRTVNGTEHIGFGFGASTLEPDSGSNGSRVRHSRSMSFENAHLSSSLLKAVSAKAVNRLQQLVKETIKPQRPTKLAQEPARHLYAYCSNDSFSSTDEAEDCTTITLAETPTLTPQDPDFQNWDNHARDDTRISTANDECEHFTRRTCRLPNISAASAGHSIPPPRSATIDSALCMHDAWDRIPFQSNHDSPIARRSHSGRHKLRSGCYKSASNN